MPTTSRGTTTEVLDPTQASAWVANAAHWLSRAGLNGGDRVAIVTPEHRFPKAEAARLQCETIAISLACLQLGLVPVMINPLLTDAEQSSIIADCRPRHLVRAAAEFDALVAPVGSARVPDLSSVPIGRPMHYTSGTTGTPKGVWTHDLSEVESAVLWAEEQEQWGFEANDRYLLHGPLCHSAPLRFAHATLLAGGTVLCQGWFDAEDAAEAMWGLEPTIAFAVPTQLQRLLNLAETPPATYRMLAHAGAPCPPHLKRALHDWAGPDAVWEFYGSTEGQLTACSAAEWEERPGTVGRARRHRHLSLEKDVVWCSAPHYARFRYWADQEKTSKAIRADARGIRFSVGDLGRMDDDGYLFLEGRREDLIITGGVNVYPAEVERILNLAPGVEQAAVFGLMSDEWGQQVTAAFVGEASPDDVMTYAREHLAAHQRPKVIHRVEDLPFTASGKLQRLRVADLFQPAPNNQ